MSVSAATVSRILGQAFSRATWLSSSRVRGWGNWTEGFQVEQVGSERAAVYYNAGSWAPRDQEKLDANARVWMDKYVERLVVHGYAVSTLVPRKVGGENPNRIEVTR